MGRRGPPRVPLSVLKKRDSALAKSREKAGVPDPHGRPTCPRFVPAGGRKYWAYLIPELEALGVLARIDRAALGRYCTQLWRYECAVKLLEEKGDTVLTDEGFTRERPEVARSLKISEGLLRLEKEFGMTPAARSSLMRNAGGKEKPAAGGKGRFFERRA